MSEKKTGEKLEDLKKKNTTANTFPGMINSNTDLEMLYKPKFGNKILKELDKRLIERSEKNKIERSKELIQQQGLTTIKPQSEESKKKDRIREEIEKYEKSKQKAEKIVDKYKQFDNLKKYMQNMSEGKTKSPFFVNDEKYKEFLKEKYLKLYNELNENHSENMKIVDEYNELKNKNIDTSRAAKAALEMGLELKDFGPEELKNWAKIHNFEPIMSANGMEHYVPKYKYDPSRSWFEKIKMTSEEEDKDYEALQAHVDSKLGYENEASFGRFLGDNTTAGMADFNQIATETLDFIIEPDYVYGDNGPISRLKERVSARAATHKNMANAANESKGGGGYNVGGELIQGTVSALPNTVLSFFSGGASGAATLGNTPGLRGAINSMAKNPMFWSSFLQSVGSDYETAKENGATEGQAVVSALTTSLINSGVEIGGGIETLPQKTAGQTTVKKILEWLKSTPEEGMEETLQGVVTNSIQKLIYDKEKEVFSPTDENAIINPNRMVKEFGMGTAVGAILGGGQTAVMSGIDTISNKTQNTKKNVLMGNLIKRGGEESVQKTVDRALTLPEDTEAYKLASNIQNKIENGKTVSSYELGELHFLRQNINNLKTDAGAILIIGKDKPNTAFMKRLSERTGINVKIADFYDKATNKKIVNAEGAFDSSTNTMYFSPKATKGDVVRGVAMHELTHAIESSEFYKAYADFAIHTKYKTEAEFEQAKRQKIHEYAENGKTLTTDGATRELVADFTRNYTFADEKAINHLVQTNPGLARQIYNKISETIAKMKYHFKGADKEFKQLTDAREMFRKALDSRSGTNTGVEYSIQYTSDNTPFVVVEEDILKDVPKSQWVRTVNKVIKEKFSNGITIGNNFIKINKTSRGKFLNSPYNEVLRKNTPETYKNKLQTANNIDEILKASRGWIGEGLDHERNDNIVEFARGNVLFKIGKNNYNADVLVATTKDGSMELYDVYELKPTIINKKSQTKTAVASNNGINGASPLFDSTESIAQENPSVKTDFELASEKAFAKKYLNDSNMQNEEKNTQYSFAPSAETETDIRASLPTKAVEYLGRAERGLLGKLGEIFSVPKNVQKTELAEVVKSISNEYLQNGTVPGRVIDDLFERAYSAGMMIDEEYLDQYREVKDYFKGHKIHISEADKANIGDYRVWRDKVRGIINPSLSSGISINETYMALQEIAPDLFPNDVVNSADQLEKMIEISEGLVATEVSLDDYYRDDVGGFREYAKHEFEMAVEQMSKELSDVVRYSEDRNRKTTENDIIDLSRDSELHKRVEGIRGAEKYKKIAEYILELFSGQSITLSDGVKAIIDNRDAAHIAYNSGDKKTAYTSQIDKIIKNAKLYALEENAEHNKFDSFRYYKATVKLGSDVFSIYLNVGNAKNKTGYHIYDITTKIRETADRINGLERVSDDLRSANSFSYGNNISQIDEKVKEAYRNIKQARDKADKVSKKNLLTETDQKKVRLLLEGILKVDQLDPAVDNVQGIKAVYEASKDKYKYEKILKQHKNEKREIHKAEARELLGDERYNTDKKMGLLYSTETMVRNFEDIFGYENSRKFKKAYTTPLLQNEAKARQYKNELKEIINELNISEKVKKGNTVSEAAAIQIIGEKDNLPPHFAAQLREENPNFDYDELNRKAEVIRELYDRMHRDISAVYEYYGYDSLEYRKDYFPHFESKIKDSFLEQIAADFGIDPDVDILPTSINGRTHMFKPGRAWFEHRIKRKGYETDFNVLEGFDKYLEGASLVIFHTSDIRRFRGLEQELRDRAASDEKRYQAELINQKEDLTEAERDVLLANLYDERSFELSNFASELQEFTNLLANKKSLDDRQDEKDLGRGRHAGLKKLAGRVAGNLVAVNPGVWVKQFIPIAQGWAMLDEGRIGKAIGHTLRSYFKPDGFFEQSAFLITRESEEALSQRNIEKIETVLSKPMECIDLFAAEVLVRARYSQNLDDGMPHTEAMEEADEWVGKIMGGRSRGAKPTLFERKNFLNAIITQFQLEANNQWRIIAKDIPRERRRRGKAKLSVMLFKFVLGMFVTSEWLKKTTGSDGGFDAAGIINETIGDFTGYQLPNIFDLIEDGISPDEKVDFTTEKEELFDAVGNLTKNVVEEVPFVGGLIGGGRLPIDAALPDIEKIGRAVFTDDMNTGERLKALKEGISPTAYYLLPPFGGGQIKKSVGGIKSLIDKGVYDSNGRLRYPVEDNTGNRLKALLFGKNSFDTAQEHWDKGRKDLTEDETADYKLFLERGYSPTEAYDRIYNLKDFSKSEQSLYHLKKAMGQDADAYLEEVRNMPDTEEKPNIRDEIKKKYDVVGIGLWGEVYYDEDTISRGKSASSNIENNKKYASAVASSGVNNEIERLYNNVSDFATHTDKTAIESMYEAIHGDKDITKTSVIINYETIDFDEEMFTQYNGMRGKLSYEIVAGAVNNQSYNSLSDSQKANVIAEAYDYASAKAKESISDGKYTTDGKNKMIDEVAKAGVRPEEFLICYSKIGKRNKENVRAAIQTIPTWNTGQRLAVAKAIMPNVKNW